MGCTDSRLPPNSISKFPSSLESLPIPSTKLDKVIRKYCPDDFVSPKQFAQVLEKLKLVPLAPQRLEFYEAMRDEKGFFRTHLLVSGIMQGTEEDPEVRMKLLFEVADTEATGLVKAVKFRTLASAMVHVALVYSIAFLKPDSPQRSIQENYKDSVESITDRIISRIAPSREVSVQDLYRLLSVKGWSDIATPEGLRNLVESPEFQKDKSEARDDGSITTAEEQKPRRNRHRRQTERGRQVSEHIRTKGLRHFATIHS